MNAYIFNYRGTRYDPEGRSAEKHQAIIELLAYLSITGEPMDVAERAMNIISRNSMYMCSHDLDNEDETMLYAQIYNLLSPPLRQR